jgi:predicted nucleic acid-binding protein
LIFVDSNVPMYLVGENEAMKARARSAVERLLAERNSLVTSVEVFHELLHRYVTIKRHDAIQPAFDALTAVVDAVLGLTEEDITAAKDIAITRPELPARDALHTAVMRRHRISQILTFDQHFDQLPDIARLPRA